MNTYAEQRRARLAAILEDAAVHPAERLRRAAEFLEGELKAAYTRGVRQPKRRMTEAA